MRESKPKELTQRHREVLNLIARGLRNKEIAEVLGITASAAGAHRWELMDRIGVCSTAEATHYAIRAGITPLMEFDEKAPAG